MIVVKVEGEVILILYFFIWKYIFLPTVQSRSPNCSVWKKGDWNSYTEGYRQRKYRKEDEKCMS